MKRNKLHTECVIYSMESVLAINILPVVELFGGIIFAENMSQQIVV